MGAAISILNPLVGIALILAIVFAFLTVSKLNDLDDPNLASAKSNFKAVGWILLSALIIDIILMIMLGVGFVSVVRDATLSGEISLASLALPAGIAVILGLAVIALIIAAFVFTIIAFLNINNSPDLLLAKNSGAYGFALATLILVIFVFVAFTFNGIIL